MSEQKVCLFYPACYEDKDVFLQPYNNEYSEFAYPDPVQSTLEETPPWVRKRVALINILEPYEETPFGEWQPGDWRRRDGENPNSIYRTYFIIVTEKTAKTWGKGWKKR